MLVSGEQKQMVWCVLATVVWLLGSAGSQRPPPNYSYDALPETSFSCRGRTVGGYYADVEAGCQMFHVCGTTERTSFRFLCPNDTVFDQQHLICASWFQVNCDSESVGRSRNFEIFKTDVDRELTFNAIDENDLPDLDDYDYEFSLGTNRLFGGNSRRVTAAPNDRGTTRQVSRISGGSQLSQASGTNGRGTGRADLSKAATTQRPTQESFSATAGRRPTTAAPAQQTRLPPRRNIFGRGESRLSGTNRASSVTSGQSPAPTKTAASDGTPDISDNVSNVLSAFFTTISPSAATESPDVATSRPSFTRRPSSTTESSSSTRDQSSTGRLFFTTSRPSFSTRGPSFAGRFSSSTARPVATTARPGFGAGRTISIVGQQSTTTSRPVVSQAQQSPRPASVSTAFQSSTRPASFVTPRPVSPSASPSPGGFTTPRPLFTTTGKFPFGFTSVPRQSFSFGNSGTFSFGAQVRNQASASSSARPSSSDQDDNLNAIEDNSVVPTAPSTEGRRFSSAFTTARPSLFSRTSGSVTSTTPSSIFLSTAAPFESQQTGGISQLSSTLRTSVSSSTEASFESATSPRNEAVSTQRSRGRARGRGRFRARDNAVRNQDNSQGRIATTPTAAEARGAKDNRITTFRPSGNLPNVLARGRGRGRTTGSRRGSRGRGTSVRNTVGSSSTASPQGQEGAPVSVGTTPSPVTGSTASAVRGSSSRATRRPTVRISSTPAAIISPEEEEQLNEINIVAVTTKRPRPRPRGRGTRRFNPRKPGGNLSRIQFRRVVPRGRSVARDPQPASTARPAAVTNQVTRVTSTPQPSRGRLNGINASPKSSVPPQESVVVESEDNGGQKALTLSPLANILAGRRGPIGTSSQARQQLFSRLVTLATPLVRVTGRPGQAETSTRASSTTTSTSSTTTTLAPQVIRKRIRVRGRPSRQPSSRGRFRSTTTATTTSTTATPQPTAETSTLPTNKEVSGFRRQNGFFLRPKLQLSSVLPSSVRTLRLEDASAQSAERTGRSGSTAGAGFNFNRLARSSSPAPSISQQLADILATTSAPVRLPAESRRLLLTSHDYDYDYEYYDSEPFEHSQWVKESERVFQTLSRKAASS